MVLTDLTRLIEDLKTACTVKVANVDLVCDRSACLIFVSYAVQTG